MRAGVVTLLRERPQPAGMEKPPTSGVRRGAEMRAGT